MEKELVSLPLYAKLAQIVLGLVAAFFVLYVGASIIVPLLFALLISILLNPIVGWLHRKGINRILAIAMSIFLLILFFGGIIYFISAQIKTFNADLPELKTKFTSVSNSIFQWVSSTFSISQKSITQWIIKMQSDGLSGGTVGQTLVSFSTFIAVIILMPVYIFMFLFYKPLLLEFISELFPKGELNTVNEVLVETKSLIQNYLVGLLLEMILVAVLNTTALLIIGVKYAILLGVIGALLNVIPYIGGVAATALPAILAMLMKAPVDGLFVVLAYLVVQFIDNNFFVPRIVASKVKINALIAIVVVLIGGALWGVAGMFLAIPLTAILKVIFDRVAPLKPFGFLLGDTMPPMGTSYFKLSTTRVRQVKKEKV